jgi:hypothetical protein
MVQDARVGNIWVILEVDVAQDGGLADGSYFSNSV